MKKKTYYTLLFTKNDSSDLKKFSIESKHFHIFLGLLGVLFLLLTAFLTDYFAVHVDHWKLTKLKKENDKLQKKLAYVDIQFKDLEKKVYQISNFSRKLQLITNTDSNQINSLKTMGRVHSNSAVLALSAHSKKNRSPSSHKENRENIEKFNPFPEESLELRIEKLKEKSEWVKQDTWTLYTDLLEKKEILNNTPSILPAKGWISSHFGYRNETIFTDHEPYFHRGMDIAGEEGSPVFASANGKVAWTGYDEHGYGNLVVIDHGYGLKTYYAHLSKIQTQAGKSIQKGEVIAHLGSTGRSTGPHLHYEVRIFGVPVNPDNYILDQSDLLVY